MSKDLVTTVIKKELKKEIHNKIVFLCIGTNSIIGDSVGPKIGSILKENLKNNKTIVLGTTSNEINYVTINKSLENRIRKFENPFVITIDSALANSEFIGKIIVNKEHLHLGKALRKGKYILGDINIKAVIGENFNNTIKNNETLTKVPEDFINKIVTKLAYQILKAF